MNYPRPVYLAWQTALLAALFFAGCSSKSEYGELKLTNTMELKAQREAEQLERSAQLEEENLALEESRRRVNASALKAAELAVFEAPAGYRVLQPEEIQRLQIRDTHAIPPFHEVIWENSTAGIRIIAGKVDMDAAKVTGLSRYEFMEELKKVDSAYDAYYTKIRNARSNLKIRENGELIVVEVVSKYLKEGDWFTDSRTMYLYRPDYRLNIVISGRDADLARHEGEIQDALKSFEENLRKLYSEGISFRR